MYVLRIVGLEVVEQLLEHTFGARLRLPDQLADSQVVVAGPAAVAVFECGFAAYEQDDEVVGPQPAQPVHRVSQIGVGFGAVHDFRIAEERVQRLRVVGRGARGASVVRERLFVSCAGPLQDRGASQEQIRPVAAQVEGPIDRGQRGFVLVLSKQRDGQIRVAERLVGRKLDQFPIGAFGIGRPLVFELRIAEIPQACHLFGRLSEGSPADGERGENENTWAPRDAPVFPHWVRRPSGRLSGRTRRDAA